MRPLLRPTAPPGVPPQGPLGHKASSTINKAFKGSVSVTDAVSGLWGWVCYRFFEEAPDPGQPFSQQTVRDALYSELYSRYPLAGPDLVRGYGMFCSYCEIRLAAYQVEHKVPKVPHVTYVIDWDNLLPVCAACNQAKGNRPTMDTIYDALPGTAVTTEPGTYEEYMDDHYLFPDVWADTYFSLAPELCDLDGDPLDDEIQFCRTATVVEEDPAERWVEAVFATGTLYAEHQTRALLQAEGGKAEDTLGLIKLNAVREASASTDFRVYWRTVAWYNALRAAGLVEGAKTKAEFDLAWENLIELARLSGFFSVWVKILSDVGVARKFVSDSTKYFKNTDVVSMLNAKLNKLAPDTLKIPTK